uniref:C-type lectin domain-containing protein n=1 Tax=Biomphalaria glabrata TaxID=6526 RepID=A0A2C9M479_BIOGL
MFSKLLLVASILVTLVKASQETDVCPPGLARDQYLQVRGDICYEFVLYRRHTHSQAKADCEKNAGMLALIKDQDTQNYLYDQLLNTYNRPFAMAWIGLNDIVQESRYVWDDGTLPVYSHWAASEGPSATLDHGSHDCVVLDVAAGGKWRDVFCERDTFLVFFDTEEAHVYICQYPVQTVATTTVATTHLDGGVQTSTTGVQIITCPVVVCQLGCAKVSNITSCPECVC